jgi:S-adenosylmethionine-dependent carboxyl methyltransferase
MQTAQHSEMEGGGYYNAHSRPQAWAGELGVPLLRRAAAEIPLGGAALAIADLGSSQGNNSMEPMREAIAALRSRDANVPIAVTHTDLPANDFNALFELVANSPGSYLRSAENVYAFAAGGSFYTRLFPERSIDLAWNSIAVHWLSSVPREIPNHIWSPYAQGAVREAFRERAAQDWNNFLNARAAEMRPGAQLVVVASSADDRGFAGAEGLMDVANGVLLEMIARGTLTKQQYEAMTIPTYYRTKTEFEQPFAPGGAFELLEATPTVLSDPFWPAYQSSGDAQGYAQSAATFFRAFSEPCLFGQPGSAAAGEFYEGVQKRIAADPASASCKWQLLLMRARANPSPASRT